MRHALHACSQVNKQGDEKFVRQGCCAYAMHERRWIEDRHHHHDWMSPKQSRPSPPRMYAMRCGTYLSLDLLPPTTR